MKFLSDSIDLKVYRALMSRDASGKGVIPAHYDRAMSDSSCVSCLS